MKKSYLEDPQVLSGMRHKSGFFLTLAASSASCLPVDRHRAASARSGNEDSCSRLDAGAFHTKVDSSVSPRSYPRKQDQGVGRRVDVVIRIHSTARRLILDIFVFLSTSSCICWHARVQHEWVRVLSWSACLFQYSVARSGRFLAPLVFSSALYVSVQYRQPL